MNANYGANFREYPVMLKLRKQQATSDTSAATRLLDFIPLIRHLALPTPLFSAMEFKRLFPITHTMRQPFSGVQNSDLAQGSCGILPQG